MTESGRLAQVTVCDARECRTTDLLVRGNQISFVSLEQVQRVGVHKLDADAMPSDVKLPRELTLVHDTVGRVLQQCDLYVLKWKKLARSNGAKIAPSSAALRDAEAYFFDEHDEALPQVRGRVNLPKNREQSAWRRLAKVRFIRYHRPGFTTLFEHEYEVPVDVWGAKHELAFRLPLPSGCVVDERGFVWP